MRSFSIEPIDTWFFRDGTPYSTDTGSQMDVGGPFPPSPLSVAGAFRAAMAMMRGWDGAGRWPEELNSTLGDGPDDLGRLYLQGPFVAWKHELLLPSPRHLLLRRADNGHELDFARVGSGVISDLGPETLLPTVLYGAKPVSRTWVRKTEFENILNGIAPSVDSLISEGGLWSEEPRTGIQRNLDTRTARDGMLYSSRHFRLRQGTALTVAVSGVPSEWAALKGVFPFGGESRLAFWQEWPGKLSLKMPLDRICDEGRFILIALTPLQLSRDVCLGRTLLHELGGALVKAACMDRPIRVGGWDSLSRQPRPMRSYVAPGSAFFCETQDRQAFVAALGRIADRIPAVGEATAVGFGCVALGSWIEGKEPA